MASKYSLPCTEVLGFVAYIVTSKVLGIDAAENSCGDVRTIRSGKRSAIISDISDKQSIFLHLPVLNTLEFNSIIPTNNFMTNFQVMTGMKRMMLLINS